MQKTEVRDAILRSLEGESVPVNFERLFEKVKKDFKCSRKTFSDYLSGLVRDDLVIREEITSRNVRYRINAEGLEKIRKFIAYQKDKEREIDTLVKKIRNIDSKSGKNRSKLLTEVFDSLEDLFGFVKFYTFFEASQMLKPGDLKQLKNMHNITVDLTKLIFSELKKQDESAYKVLVSKMFLKMLSQMGTTR